MLLKSIRRIIGVLTLVLVAGGMLTPNAHAQKGGTGVFNDEVTWPTVFNLGFGGAANDNWQGSGTYTVGDGPTYSQSSGLANPEFHINFEIPIARNLMFAPRIAYNDYSLHWNHADPNTNAFNGLVTGGSFGTGDPNALVISHLDVGTDLLFKYALSNFHVMAGANLSWPVRFRFAHSNAIEDARDGSDIPSPAKFIAGLKGGIGYDIPLNMKHTIWLAPEAFFTYSVVDFSQAKNGFELFPVTLSGGASLKFALPGAAPPPPVAELGATINARGVLPDGTLTAEPVVPQQALHTRVSMPLLPYIFFDNMESAIPARYTRMGATGFSMQMLANKDAMDANHAVLDVVGQRMKDNPAANLRIVGTNSNSGGERNNINLSRARAMAARDYLVSTWGVDAGRITIDQRNLPEIPTNPATQAGITENRRVEFSSNNPDITGPVKIENREAVSVGQTVIRYETTVTPADWPWASWSITLDNNGQPIAPALGGSATLSGSGAPPAVQTMTLADASRWIDQPLHYKLTVTDNTGRTATADGYTRIVNKTVDRDNLERFAMLSFDFDKADINQRARQMLQLISESISRDATGVRIDGFCDATGTPQYNQTLSEERANSAVAALRAMSTLPANVTVAGHGLRDPRFTNDLPEGRQLNRRVEFTIEKSTR